MLIKSLVICAILMPISAFTIYLGCQLDPVVWEAVAVGVIVFLSSLLILGWGIRDFVRRPPSKAESAVDVVNVISDFMK